MFALRLKDTALKLITNYGNSGVLTRVTLGEYDPDTGRKSETETNYNIKYYKSNFSTFEISQGVAGANDFKATISFEEEVDKTWLLDGAEIINILKVESQDNLIIQELQCRK